MRAADAATLKAIAHLVAGDQVRGRRVTGSTAVPMMQPIPSPAQTAPVTARGWVRWDLAAATTAASGIGHGAATPASSRPAAPPGPTAER